MTTVKLKSDLDLLRSCVKNLVTLPLNHPAIETSLVNLENLCATVRRKIKADKEFGQPHFGHGERE